MKRFVLTTIGVCGLAGWMLSLAFLLFTHTVLKDMAGLVFVLAGVFIAGGTLVAIAHEMDDGGIS